jgi:intracellular sulfur oxidation DsrE/DsrF family protein
MNDINLKQPTPRRGFLGLMATGAAALGLTALTSPFRVNGQQKTPPMKTDRPAAPKNDADVWFGKVKGTHRAAFDCTRPHEVMPMAWPLVFLMTNEATGSPASDCGVVVILRHEAIAYAFKDELWAKYKFSEVFKGTDDLGHAYSGGDASTGKTRNPFLNTKKGDFKLPGFGEVDLSIKGLMDKGVMFAVCNAATTVYTAAVAGMTNQKAEDVYNEWKANLVPGMMLVPSGVWACGRAKEHGCAYIFAG